MMDEMEGRREEREEEERCGASKQMKGKKEGRRLWAREGEGTR